MPVAKVTKSMAPVYTPFVRIRYFSNGSPIIVDSALVQLVLFSTFEVPLTFLTAYKLRSIFVRIVGIFYVKMVIFFAKSVSKRLAALSVITDT
jgi:hypothetical protein